MAVIYLNFLPSFPGYRPESGRVLGAGSIKKPPAILPFFARCHAIKIKTQDGTMKYPQKT